MKMLKRTLALMLVLCMMFTAMPFNAFATESTDEPSVPTEAPVDAPETASEDEVVPEDEEVPEVVEEEPIATYGSRAIDTSSFIKVFHLDCGRKYFTVDQVKELIHALSDVGFSHMELAIGNDGLRLLLDDMSIEANGTTYASDTVKSGIQTGNSDYSHSGEWTEAEMDTIIAYAKTKGIEIIPLVNNPGHMDSILAAMSACGIDGNYASSVRTVDLENAEAVAFTQALVMKYAEYFAAKGCKYFNIGADEYANDYHTSDSTGMGFGYLVSKNKYGNFVNYVNTLVADICDLDMTPIAFNDGIYYNSTTSQGTFDTRLVVAAWTGGWGGIKPASTSFLQSKGHQILNTNERWYYVLGRAQASNSTYCYESALSNAKSVDVTTVTDNTGAVPMGAMQCVWCDVPSVDYETYKSKVMTLISTLAENNTDYFTGPNEVTPEPEEPDVPEEPETVTKTDEATKVEITAPGLETVEVKENAAVVTEEKVSKTYSITLNGGAYTEDATVKIPYDTAFDGCNAFTGYVDGDEFTVTKEGDFFICDVPHFSDVEIEGRAVAEDSVVAGSGTASSYVLDKDGLDVDAQYLIVYDGNALTNNKGSLAVTVNGDNATPSADASSALWTYSADYNNYYGYYNHRLSNGSNYLYTSVSGSWYDRQYNLFIDENNNTLTITSNDNGTYTVGRNSYGTNSYVAYISNGWGAQSTSQNLSFYKYTPGTQTFKVNAALQESRIAAATVANDGYTDETWNAYQAALKAAQDKLAEVEAASYNSQSAAEDARDELIAVVDALEAAKNALAKARTITVNYQEDGVTVGSSELNISDTATTYTLPTTVGFNGKVYRVETTTLTITSEPSYNVAVTEIPFDPSTVAPLTVEYWITNLTTRTADSTNEDPVNTQQISAGAEGVATANGADINAMMPEWTIKKDGDSGADRQVEFWHVRMLDVTKANNSTSGTEQQTLRSGDNETTNGSAVTRVRYYDPGDGNGYRWQLLAGSTWLDVDRTEVTVNKYGSDQLEGTETREKTQIVAYYMEVVDIKNANTGVTELHVNAADWGKPGDASRSDSYTDPSNYCTISLQIVYEDGTTTNPAGTTVEVLDSKTIVFNYWDTGRGIGTFAFDTMGQFNIYQITAETGDVEANITGAWGTAQVTSFDWDDNEKVVWTGNSETASIYNNSNHPSKEGVLENLMWDHNKEAILIRIYVKAIETPNSLRVHYIDRTAHNLEFYNYFITTPEGEIFDEGFAMTGEGLELVNNNVTNYYDGQERYVSADLQTMPEIKAYYRYCNYELVEVTRSTDGKDVYLYYEFSPVISFVADFGLPLTITPNDLNPNGYTDGSITGVQVIGSKDTVASSTAHSEYGDLSVNGTSVTYTPTTTLKNVDFFSVYVETTADNPNTTTNESAGINYRVYIFPATTVYYEESFLDYTGTWSKPAAPSILQTTEILGSHKHHYGYDPIYAGAVTNDADDTRGSNNTKASTSTNGATASFTFTGTGFELYANCNDGTGYVTVTSEGQTKKMYMIDTGLNYAEDNVQMPGTTATPSGNFYNIPIISEKNLPHGTYTVTIRKSHADNQAFEIDGFRVINTINESAITDNTKSIYYADKEDKPVFYQLRDFVLNSIGITNADAKQVYTDVAGAKAIVTTAGVDYDDTAAQDLLNHGPKNELYLFAGQTLTFSVKTDRLMQIGLKAPNGATTYDLKCTGVTNKTNVTMGTSVDMFYELGNATGTETTFTVTVKNTGNNILAVTDLKICDDPNAAFVALSEDDIAVALGQKIEEDVTPEVPTEPEVPETTKPSKPGKPNKPSKPTKPTEPEVEETKPSKPGNGNKPGNNKPGKPENTKPTEPQKPGKPGNNGNQKPGKEEKTYTLKITFVNLFGKKVGTATINTTKGMVSAYEIVGKAPAGRMAIWLIPVTLRANGNNSIVVPVI